MRVMEDEPERDRLAGPEVTFGNEGNRKAISDVT